MPKKLQKDSELPMNPRLLEGLKNLIEGSRAVVITTVNATLTMLHWQIGKRMKHGELTK